MNIVIPIKNVNYMLRGINIGGDKRLKYLNYLKKKQDENIEKLEKIYLFKDKKTNKGNELIQETDSDLVNNDENEDNLSDIDKIQSSNDGKLNKDLDFEQKFDEESDYIEKEISFYDFDEQLLQYRSLEIELLMRSLIDLKDALTLTSEDRGTKEIIGFSHSEKIFTNFKNKEGAIICQSNLGNLQSQLLKFDKAIYHLALSLQDNKLKKFLNKN